MNNNPKYSEIMPGYKGATVFDPAIDSESDLEEFVKPSFRSGTYGLKTDHVPVKWYRIYPSWVCVLTIFVGFAACTFPWWVGLVARFYALIFK